MNGSPSRSFTGSRGFAYHVELFLSGSELALFWDTHAALPMKKIQLR